MPHDGAGRTQKRNALEHFVTGHGVLAHFHPFFRRELGGLQENRVGDGDLADIVQQGALFERGQKRRRVTCPPRQVARVGAHSQGMREGLVFTRIERRHQGFQSHLVVGFQFAQRHLELARAALDAGFKRAPVGSRLPRRDQALKGARHGARYFLCHQGFEQEVRGLHA